MKKKSKGNWWSNRHRKYRYDDKKRGFSYDFSLEEAKAIMQLPCYYCGNPKSQGMDRLDSNKGHVKGNIVSSCFYCNMILSNLPLEAKMELREGLRRIYEKGILQSVGWKPPPHYVPNHQDKKKFDEHEKAYNKMKTIWETTAGDVQICNVCWKEKGIFCNSDHEDVNG